MGWLVKQKESKGITQYRIWSTITDSYISKWMTKEESIRYIFWNKLFTFSESILETAMMFPNGYYEKGMEKRIWDDNNRAEYDKFMGSALKKNNSHEIIMDKFQELIKEVGIEISVNDKDGYSI